MGAGIELQVVEEDIQIRSDWQIDAHESHALIVHLDGPIGRIETLVDNIGYEVAPLGAGDMSLIPNGHHYLCCAEGGVVRHATLRIQQSRLRTSPHPERAPELRLALACRDPFLYESIRRLISLSAQEDDVSQMIGAGLLQAIIGHLIQCYSEDSRVEAPTAAATALIADRLRLYVQDNLDNRICLDDLATVAGVGMSELFETFRREFRTTPAQFVIERRLERARVLLTHSGLDITSIALATGFSSHSHLTTTFKKHFGFVPSALRPARRSKE